MLQATPFEDILEWVFEFLLRRFILVRAVYLPDRQLWAMRVESNGGRTEEDLHRIFQLRTPNGNWNLQTTNGRTMKAGTAAETEAAQTAMLPDACNTSLPSLPAEGAQHHGLWLSDTDTNIWARGEEAAIWPLHALTIHQHSLHIVMCYLLRKFTVAEFSVLSLFLTKLSSASLARYDSVERLLKCLRIVTESSFSSIACMQTS